jgi:hypothetical protein
MKRLVGSLILAVSLLVPAAVSASAASVINPQQPSAMIFACVLNNTSQQNVRIVHENTNCKANEHSVTWEEEAVGTGFYINACVLKNISQQNVRIISGPPEFAPVQPDKKMSPCTKNENELTWENDPSGDIFACVLNNTSQQNLRIVHEGTNCSNNEYALEWDSTKPCNAAAATTCVMVRRS